MFGNRLSIPRSLAIRKGWIKPDKPLIETTTRKAKRAKPKKQSASAKEPRQARIRLKQPR